MSEAYDGVKTGVVVDYNGKLMIIDSGSTPPMFTAEFNPSDNTIGINNSYNPLDIYHRLIVFIESQPEH